MTRSSQMPPVDYSPRASTRPPLAERITLSTDAVARVAAWPIEALTPFAAPELAARARELARLEGEIRARAPLFVEEIFAAVPRFHDRGTRAFLLAVKRIAYNSVYPWPGPSPRETRTLAEQAPALRARLDVELEARIRLGDESSSFAAAYDVAFAAQRRALGEIADGARFGRALVIANPDLASLWRRRERGVRPWSGRTRKLETSVLYYLLRTVGRPTPHGAWSGVARVSLDETAPPLRVLPLPASTVAAPDLRLFREVIHHLAASDRYLREYPLRLDPSVHQSGDSWWYVKQDRWARLPGAPLITVLLDAYQDGEPHLAEPLLELLAERSDAPSRLRSLLDRTVAALIRGGVLRSALEFPSSPRGVLDALLAVAPRLLEPEREVWTSTVDRCRIVCERLAASFDTLSPETVAAIVAAAAAAVRELRLAVGLDGETAGAVIRLDRSAPCRITWSPRLRERLSIAVGAVLALHAEAGGAEAFRRALLQNFKGRTHSLVTVLRELEHVHVGGEGWAAGRRSWDAWVEARIEPSEEALRLQVDPLADSRPGPAGTMAFALTGDDMPSLRWARPQPDLAEYRLWALLGPPRARTPGACGCEPIEVVGIDAANPNAAVRTPGGAREVGRHAGASVPLAALSVEIDEEGRPWICDPDVTNRLVPTYSATSGIGLSDPVGRALLRMAMAHGWDFVSYGFPLPVSRNGSLGRITLGDDVIVSLRRWVLPAALLSELRAATPAEQYRRFRSEVEARDMGDWLWLAPLDGAERSPMLVRTDSPLIIHAVLWHLAESRGDLVGMELPGDPAGWPVQDEAGRHYLAEIAVTWADPGHFEEVCPP
jgi:hypothetical protein